MGQTLYRGERICELIPQRRPILVVDTLLACDDEGCTTGLYVRPDNMFCRAGGFIAEGVIEHMAQSASAFMGFHSISSGREISTGYIGEVRKFELTGKIAPGSQLTTVVRVVSRVGDIVLVKAETSCGGKQIASCSMKITA